MTLTLPRPRATPPAPEVDLDVQKVVLDVVNRKVKGLDTRVDQSMIDGNVERTILGASTIDFTIHDPRRALLQSGMFDQTIEVTLDDLHWRLVKVTKNADDLALTFEDRAVSYLREIDSPKKASRAVMTRAEFAYSIVREVKKGGGLKFYCPELRVVQPIANAKQQTSSTTRAATKSPGVHRDTSGVTVAGAKATATQLRYAERALDVAASLGASDKAKLALIEACIVESHITNPTVAIDHDSRGILQIRDSTAKPMGINNLDIEASCNAFLTRGFTGKGGAIAIARSNPGMSAGQVAQAVQGSAYPTRYDGAQTEAQAILTAYGGGDPGAAIDQTTTKTVTLPYQFQRGGSDGTVENSWDCLQRLASEVNWRCFVVGDTCYFISDDELMKAKPTAVLNEQSPGVSAIDFDLDTGKPLDQVTITCRAKRWYALPGAVIQLEQMGPADGRWLVNDLRRGIFDANTTITLQRPSKKYVEPANQTTQVTVGGSGSGSDQSAIAAAAAAGSPCARAYQAAQALSAKAYPYVWDGGHAHAGTPDTGAPGPGYGGGRIGFDCSGSTGAVLAAAGLGFQPGDAIPDSGTMARSWGEAGEGQCFTVWASSVHVFIIFHTKNGDQHFGTGNWGPGGNGGARFQPQLHPTGGFTPRHWPGL